jgi:Uma2 family endonuclease
MSMRQAPEPVIVMYDVARSRAGWELSEETMPESVLHDEAVELLKALLAAWAARRGQMTVVRNLAVRWDEAHPQIGVDPDVALLSPPPSEGTDLKSLRTWMPGHAPPRLAIEVVSENSPRKDYVVAPDKYAASGTEELWIFDPLLSGPASQGGPFRLQVWRRDDAGAFARVYAGEGPARSEVVSAYLVPVAEGRKLRIAADAAATDFWLTAEEAERAAKEAERAAKEAERAAKEAALARIAELEADLRRRGD